MPRCNVWLHGEIECSRALSSGAAPTLGGGTTDASERQLPDRPSERRLLTSPLTLFVTYKNRRGEAFGDCTSLSSSVESRRGLPEVSEYERFNNPHLFLAAAPDAGDTSPAVPGDSSCFMVMVSQSDLRLFGDRLAVRT